MYTSTAVLCHMGAMVVSKNSVVACSGRHIRIFNVGSSLSRWLWCLLFLVQAYGMLGLVQQALFLSVLFLRMRVAAVSTKLSSVRCIIA